MRGTHHPPVHPYSSPKAQDTDWLDSRMRTMTRAWSLGSKAHTQCSCLLSTISSRSRNQQTEPELEAPRCRGLPALPFLSVLCKGQPEHGKTQYGCGPGELEPIQPQETVAPNLELCFGGHCPRARQDLVELCLLHGNYSLRRPQGRQVLSEAVLRYPESLSSLYRVIFT